MVSREEILSVLGEATASRRAGRFHEASEGMEKALAFCGPAQDYERAIVLREMGELARNEQDLPAAQAHYEQAVDVLRTSEDQLKFAHTIRHLGDVHRQQQHWSDAESCYIESLQIYRAHPSHASADRLDLANAIRPYALLMSDTGRHAEARPLWTEARDLYQSLGLEAGVEECSRRVGGT